MSAVLARAATATWLRKEPNDDALGSRLSYTAYMPLEHATISGRMTISPSFLLAFNLGHTSQ